MDNLIEPESRPAAFPYGVTIGGCEAFVAEPKGDPLFRYPSLVAEGRAYNLWLTDRVLDTVLRRWSRGAGDGRGPATTVASDIEWASWRGRRAFQEILPAAAGEGDPAVLAALGVTANLQRTVAILGEFILEGSPSLQPPSPLRLSRFLCGLVDYPENAPYFSGRCQAPVHAGRLRIRSTDARHLGNALWCSEAEIDRCCEEALAAMGRAVRMGGRFAPGDLRHLCADAIPGAIR